MQKSTMDTSLKHFRFPAWNPDRAVPSAPFGESLVMAEQGPLR
jgi:hypothetical protein